MKKLTFNVVSIVTLVTLLIPAGVSFATSSQNLKCEDFGFDVRVAEIVIENGHVSVDVQADGYQVTASGNTEAAQWTASPAVDGSVAKAATSWTELAGGTSGSADKSSVGSGQHGLSHIILCANETVEEPEPIVGCTDEDATNYDAEATEDDGSCILPPIPENTLCELTVEKTVSATQATPGDTLTYSFVVTNTGTEDCTGGGVRAFDYLDANFIYESATYSDNASAGYSSSLPLYSTEEHLVRFNAHTLEPGEAANFTITGTVATPDQCGDFKVKNTAKATARELNNFQDWSYSNTVKTEIDNACETPTPTCEFYPTIAAIVAGESTELNWTTTNAVRVVLSGGAGEVALNGSLPVTPLATYDYTLTAFGEEDATAECQTTITVTAQEVPGCTDATATNYNAEATVDDGSCEYPEVIPGCTDSTATNYSADATEDDGSCEYPETEVPGCTDEDATNYDAEATEDDGSCEYPSSTGGGGSASPRCELEISDSKIEVGERVTLTWETRSTRDITITDDRGNIIVTTDNVLASDKEELLDGEITVTPTRDTEYTLVAERGRRDRECSVEVEVEDTIVVLETRDQAPLVAGISLAEVPYTGFEAGPIMTTLFYALLVVWSLYLTYVFVVPKTMVPATAAVAARKTVAEQMQTAEAIRPDVFAPVSTPQVTASVAAPIAAAPANLPVAPTMPSAPVAPVAPTMPAVATAKTPVEVAALEAIAHNNQALLSSDAVTTFIAAVPVSDQLTKIVEVVNSAKAQFPLEDGWVVINNDRMLSLLVA